MRTQPCHLPPAPSQRARQSLSCYQQFRRQQSVEDEDEKFIKYFCADEDDFGLQECESALFEICVYDNDYTIVITI